MKINTLLRFFFLIIISTFINGCVGLGPAHYMTTPEGSNENRPVPHKYFKVNSSNYPTYTVANELMPPTPNICVIFGCYDGKNVKILPSDIWHVKHIYKGRYLIQSNEYNQRYCIKRNEGRSKFWDGALAWFSSDCLEKEKLAIYIDPNGNINGGWEVFKHNEMYFSPTKKETDQWENGVIFIPNKARNQNDTDNPKPN